LLNQRNVRDYSSQSCWCVAATVKTLRRLSVQENKQIRLPLPSRAVADILLTLMLTEWKTE